MEPKIYRMAKKNRIIQYLAGGYLFLPVILCLAYFFTNTTLDPSETIAILVVMPLSLIGSCNFLLPIFKNRLVYTEEGVEYVTTFNRHFFNWNEFSGCDIDNNVLHAYFNLETLTPTRKLKEVLFGDPNDIPISNYIEGWKLEKTRMNDPLLRTMESIMRAREDKTQQALNNRRN